MVELAVKAYNEADTHVADQWQDNLFVLPVKIYNIPETDIPNINSAIFLRNGTEIRNNLKICSGFRIYRTPQIGTKPFGNTIKCYGEEKQKIICIKMLKSFLYCGNIEIQKNSIKQNTQIFTKKQKKIVYNIAW